MVTRSIGTGAPGFSAFSASASALHPVDQRGVGRAEVRAGGGGGVVGLGRGRRGAAVEVAGRGEALADQGGADDLAVALDQAAVGLGGKDAWPRPVMASG